MNRRLWLCLALSGSIAAAQTSAETTLRRTFVQKVAPNLDGASGLTLEGLTNLVTAWVKDVRREKVTTLEKEVEQGVAAVERLVRKQAADITERCKPGPGADVAWNYLDNNEFILKPGLVGDFTPLHTALKRCLSFEVVFRSEIRLQGGDSEAVTGVTTGVEAVVPIQVDLQTRVGSGQGALTHTRVDWQSPCVPRNTTTSGLLRVDDFGRMHKGLGPFDPGYTEYAFEYRITAPQVQTILVCGPAAAEVPGANDFTWSGPFRIAHKSEFSTKGYYLPPLGSHAAPLGNILNQWTWRQTVPEIDVLTTEYTTLKVVHSPR